MKIETEMPFGVGAVYKTSGFVESDIVESYESQNSEKAADLYINSNESQTSFVSPSLHNGNSPRDGETLKNNQLEGVRKKKKLRTPCHIFPI